MPYVEQLIGAGIIRDPDPLTRPLKRAAVINALTHADTMRASGPVRATIRTLLERLGPPQKTEPQYRADFFAGGSAANQNRRDPLHPFGTGYAAYQGGMQLSATAGPVVLVSDGITDRYLHVDPDYTGSKIKQPPGRFSESYISLQGKYGEVFLGALQRNWGPTGIDGFLTSSYAYSYDHLMIRAGTDAVRVEVLTTQLDDMTDSTGALIHRYWASTRLVLQPWKWFTATIDNAVLWYGPDRSFELRWINPLKLAFITSTDEQAVENQNSLVAGSGRIALPDGVVLQGSVLIDAISSGFLSGGCCDPFPSRLGATALMDVPVGGGRTFRIWTTAVTGYTYRAPEGLDNSIMLRGIGLGRNFADNWETGIRCSFIPSPMITVSPEIVYLEQGQGDFRLPTPPLPVTAPIIFEGTVERTLRFGVLAHAQLGRWLDLDLNAGLHRIGNVNNQFGVHDTRFLGRIQVRYLFGGAIHTHEPAPASP